MPAGMDDGKMNKQATENVTILFKKLTKPSSKTPNDRRTYKVSAMDQSAPARHMATLFFYTATDTISSAARLEELEESLSESLCCYYPLAGRLAADALSVDCQDQGALLMAAKVDCELNQFLDEANKDMDILNSLSPRSTIEDHDQYSEPLLRVQISSFECGGISLAVETHHVLTDGFAASMFVDFWAKMNRSFRTNEAINSTRLDSCAAIWPATERPRDVRLPLLGAKLVMKRLLFDEAAISTLREQANMATDYDIEGRPSRVELVTAFTWSGLVRAGKARHGYLRPSLLYIPVNLRGKRTSIGIPDNAFGNVYAHIPFKFMAKDESQIDQMHFFVHLIREEVRKSLLEYSRASKDEIYSMSIRAHEEVKEWFSKSDEVDTIIASSLCRFPLYEVDFGWGKPYWVSFLKSRVPSLYMLDTKCGKGIQVFLTLNEIEMQKLELNPYIAPFSLKELN